MPRIRSLFPGQWTDADFVKMSYPARLFTLALRNFADDNGVFAWNPIELKMKCLAGDNVNPEELLAEMFANRHIGRFTKNGRQYGIIRNFKKYQKPKYPTAEHPLPKPEELSSEKRDDERDLFPQSSGFCTELVPNMFGTSVAEGEEEIKGEEKKGGVGESDPPAPASKRQRATGRKVGTQQAGPRRSKDPVGSRCPDGDLPPGWLESSNALRAKHGLIPLNQADAERRWTAFQEYWCNLGGRSGYKISWQRTWDNNNIANMTERRLPPGMAITPSRFKQAI